MPTWKVNKFIYLKEKFRKEKTMENIEEYIEKTIIEKDEDGNDIEVKVKEYPNIPVVVVKDEE